MARINLLPWREELRRKRQKNFAILAGVAILAMCGVVYAVQWELQAQIDHQRERNAYLEGQIIALDRQIKDIRDLEEQRSRLIARMEIIQRLQASRPEIVHMFDALVSTVPEGVYFNRLEQKGDLLTINGVAQSNAFVSSLMRNLNRSEWLDSSTLKEIVSRGQEGTDLLRLAEFQLEVKQLSKAAPEGEGG